MKLSGTYELNNHGVLITGMVHDTRIPQVRERFKLHGKEWLVDGTLGMSLTDAVAGRYKMPAVTWIDSMVQKGRFTYDDISKILALKKLPRYTNATVVFQLSNIMVASAYPIISTRNIAYTDEGGHRHSLSVKLMNVGWIFDKVQSDGSFEAQLNGLANRHIMTMVLGAATRYAKFLDSDILWNVVKDNDNLHASRENFW